MPVKVKNSWGTDIEQSPKYTIKCEKRLQCSLHTKKRQKRIQVTHVRVCECTRVPAAARASSVCHMRTG